MSSAHDSDHVQRDAADGVEGSVEAIRGRRPGRRNRDMPEEALAEKVQTGVRMEKRLVKVLKAVAELRDMSLGDLLEQLVVSCFTGTRAFSEAELGQVADLNRIYRLELGQAPGAWPARDEIAPARADTQS
jgi:hypothetical protein